MDQQEEEQPTLSKKRKPKWVEQLLKEASEQVVTIDLSQDKHTSSEVFRICCSHE
jgi:hypothetical protein